MNPKRAQNGKPQKQPRERTYVGFLATCKMRWSEYGRHTPARYDLRQEPYEVIPHVRICTGDVGQPTFLP